MRLIAFAITAVVIVLAAVFLLLNQNRTYDRSFDTSIPTPAYHDSGPVVLYDEGHLNTHTASAGYRPLVELLRNDGYTVRTTKEAFTAEALRDVSVLMLVLAQGKNATNDSAAYSDSEAAAIDEWVRGGGAVLLITDHWPFGIAARSLGKRFGIEMGAGLVEDPQNHEPERGESHLVFSVENGMLGRHPITQGRNTDEPVRRILTFTGQSLKGPPDAVPFLLLSDAATERPPRPARAEKDGGNVRVLMEYGDPISARGRAQGVALEFGRGRVVVLGEAGMLRAERDRSGLVGMNVPGYDNRQLALNIVHWLSKLL